MNTSNRQTDPTVLFVVPSRDGGAAWLAGRGNHSFDLVESLREYIGRSHVHVLEVSAGEADWAIQVTETALAIGATHVMGHVEHDPAGSHDWTWDECLRHLRRRWAGVFVAISYDSAYPYVSMLLDRLTRMYDRTLVMAIDRPLTGIIRPRHACAGPVFLPVPSVSIAELEALTADVPVQYDLTFIGNVAGYPYRQDLISELDSAGLNVTVNPHISVGENRPGFEAYVGALKSSRITINFSRCNGEPITQLKTRILEGSLFGTIVASDSGEYVYPYFTEGTHYLVYKSPADLRSQVTSLLADTGALAEMRTRARARAIEIAPTCFWENLDRTLEQRKLQSLRFS